MDTGASLEDRRKQRELLRARYPDYDPKRHDVFVIRYNREMDQEAMDRYLERRGLKPIS